MLFTAMTLHKLGRPAEAHEVVREIGAQLISDFSADLYPGNGSYLGPLSLAQNSRELEEVLLTSLKAGVGSAAGANQDTWNS
ncbi:MAG: hypothetical protein GWO24_06770, partial [Akkermansiaceae bacterium]|nr:hypothetical protein [Akkermansiaceae bacterium]